MNGLKLGFDYGEVDGGLIRQRSRVAISSA